MKQIYLLLSFAFFVSSIQAQEMSPTRPRMELNFAMGFPTGDYAESSHDIGFGGDLGFYFPINKNTPWFQIGPQFMFLATGKNNQDISQRLEVKLGEQVIDVIDLDMRVQTLNSIAGGHLVFRGEIGSSENSFIPYIQGMLGVRRVATDITIFDESDRSFFDEDDDVINSSTALEDWIFSYGGGAGFHIRLGTGIFMNIGAYYLFGGEAEYYTDDDIDNFELNFVGSNYNPQNPKLDGDDIELNSDPTNSTTNLVQLNIGFNFVIPKKSY